MNQATNEEESPQSSSAVAESCGALFDSTPPTEEGKYLTRWHNELQGKWSYKVVEVMTSPKDGELVFSPQEGGGLRSIPDVPSREWLGPLPEEGYYP